MVNPRRDAIRIRAKKQCEHIISVRVGEFALRTHCSHRCCLLVTRVELGSDDGETNKGSKVDSSNNSLYALLLERIAVSYSQRGKEQKKANRKCCPLRIEHHRGRQQAKSSIAYCITRVRRSMNMPTESQCSPELTRSIRCKMQLAHDLLLTESWRKRRSWRQRTGR
jgi:hypothetical protein